MSCIEAVMLTVFLQS